MLLESQTAVQRVKHPQTAQLHRHHLVQRTPLLVQLLLQLVDRLALQHLHLFALLLLPCLYHRSILFSPVQSLQLSLLLLVLPLQLTQLHPSLIKNSLELSLLCQAVKQTDVLRVFAVILIFKIDVFIQSSIGLHVLVLFRKVAFLRFFMKGVLVLLD